MTEQNSTWWKIVAKWIGRVKSFLSSEKVDSKENALAQVQQQIASLQQQVESISFNIPNQIEEAVQKQLTQMTSSKIDSLEKAVTQLQQQVTHLQQQLESFTANIPNQIEEAVQKHLTQLNLSSLSTSVNKSSPQILLNKTTFAPTEEIQVSFVALSTFASNAWVGIIPSDIPHGSEAVNDQHDLSYQYLNGRTSGTLVFKAPTPNGSYDLRMHDTDSNGQEVYSVSFEVRQN
jgi:uncharacterized protein YoxC